MHGYNRQDDWYTGVSVLLACISVFPKNSSIPARFSLPHLRTKWQYRNRPKIGSELQKTTFFVNFYLKSLPEQVSEVCVSVCGNLKMVISPSILDLFSIQTHHPVQPVFELLTIVPLKVQEASFFFNIVQ